MLMEKSQVINFPITYFNAWMKDLIEKSIERKVKLYMCVFYS